MIDIIELITKIKYFFNQAFETILSKFPHYKTCYRIAEKQYFTGRYSACSDTLFHRLFFNPKKKIISSSNIFEVSIIIFFFNYFLFRISLKFIVLKLKGVVLFHIT